MTDLVRRPGLYVVATPIGNLGDVTLRALDTLRTVDLIACEDTRVTARLLAHYQIEKPLVSLHQHNERKAAARVLDALQAGKAVALVSDAGTPVVSDPGANLVEAVRAAGIPVVALPGPSAVATAWSVSGMPETGFLFHGFLPARSAERRKLLQSLAAVPYALVFYEAPHRVVDTARDLAEVLGGERRSVVARELTKRFESVHACPLGELVDWLAADENRQRGEFVLIVGGADEKAPLRADAENVLRRVLEELPPAAAARLASQLCGVPRQALYELAVRFKETS
jgi:16S rRNA (cytidine1402-2'-O)-methyltransferase